MSTPKRIYVVTNTTSTPNRQRLIRAATPAQAVRHAARDSFDVVVASQDALVLLLEAGVKVEDAEASDPQPSLITEDAGHAVP